MLLCKDGHTLAFAIKVRNRPKVAVRFKVVVVNPSQIEKVFHQRPIATMQASEVESLNLLHHGQELLPDSRYCMLTGRVGVTENSDAATAKFFNIIGEQFYAGSKGNYNANLRKPTFDIGKMQSGQSVLATFDNQQDFAAIICDDIIQSD
jgi:hypothetical protein